jgi:hypothetical protein
VELLDTVQARYDLLKQADRLDSIEHGVMRINAFHMTALALKNEFIPIWRMSHTDAPYRSARRVHAALFSRDCPGQLQQPAIAMEVMNSQRALSGAIEKLIALRSHLCVLFFYWDETIRTQRVSEVEIHVRDWQASAAEFLVMWNKPYQSQPPWRPALITTAGTKDLPVFTIN